MRHKHSRETTDNYCLVLGGGGARGAYEVGVWKALREIGIGFRAVAGTSIGALNAAFIAQGDYEAAEELYREITINQVVNIPEEFLLNGRISRNLQNLRRLSHYLLVNRGLDTAPLKRLIARHLNEEKIRRRGLDFGLVTYDLSNLKPRHLFLDEIPVGRLNEYLLASASHPLFRITEIDEDRLTDGGVVDNIPFNMMRERGYRRIIAVDLSGLGRARKPQIENCRVTWIKNSQKLDGAMDITPECSARSLNLGYLDTLRTFDRLDGIRYFIESDEPLLQRIDAALLRPDLQPVIRKALQGLVQSPSDTAQPDHRDSATSLMREILPREYRNHRSIALALLECAAHCLMIPRPRVYSIKELAQEVVSGFQTINRSEPIPPREKLSVMANRLKKELDSVRNAGIFKLPPARYAAALHRMMGGEERNRTVRMLQPIFPELGAAHLLEIIITYMPEIFY